MIRQLHGIQYLRAVAAGAVVVYHAAQRTGTRFTVGEAGVDLFFVISGFLMIAITSPQTRPLGFLRDRIKRIVPAYWIATSVFLAGALLGLFPHARPDWMHIVASYLFIPHRAAGSEAIWPLLVPGWTLNFEMFFYALFAMTLAVPRVWQLPVLTVLLAGCGLIGGLVRPQDAFGAFYTQPILLEFVAGAWLGWYWKRYGAPPGGAAAIALAIVLYVAAWWIDDHGLRVLTYGVPALLLFAGMLGLEHREGGIRHIPVLHRLGDASYAIYLWHTMILAVVVKAGRILGVPVPAIFVLGVAASLAGGVAAWWLVERPINALFKRRRTRLGVPIPGM
ncbi:acyltransferase family protein [Sphingomonas adhaesiva]|uniref:acyltransferase family protein n=1 Tax=Sphingomonas adhaesiva TaxID=28212 RepID=UPI002FF4E4B4